MTTPASAAATALEEIASLVRRRTQALHRAAEDYAYSMRTALGHWHPGETAKPPALEDAERALEQAAVLFTHAITTANAAADATLSTCRQTTSGLASLHKSDGR